MLLSDFFVRGYTISDHPQNPVGREKSLGENGFKPKYKEGDVGNSSELIPESLDFGIETLDQRVCRAILKVVGYASP